jgi:hypothetical protein
MARASRRRKPPRPPRKRSSGSAIQAGTLAAAPSVARARPAQLAPRAARRRRGRRQAAGARQSHRSARRGRNTTTAAGIAGATATFDMGDAQERGHHERGRSTTGGISIADQELELRLPVDRRQNPGRAENRRDPA